MTGYTKGISDIHRDPLMRLYLHIVKWFNTLAMQIRSKTKDLFHK